MAGRFADIAFSPSVKAAQSANGSRAFNEQFEGVSAPAPLGPRETAFIAARDGFYQASVSETGWPYVQFKGGPRGFLKVLGPRQIGYADFRGNIQYLSLGNFSANPRAALFLMDYANQRRLKLWATVAVIGKQDDPALMEALSLPDYRARVERGIVLTVEAFDWNCPQHITPRYTAEEVTAIARAHRAEQETP